jgi:uncharacterized protein (DUF58 family)
MDAVRTRVWAGAPTATGEDVTSDIRTMRDADIAIEADNSRRRDVRSLDRGDAESAAAGAALLAHLGL